MTVRSERGGEGTEALDLEPPGEPLPVLLRVMQEDKVIQKARLGPGICRVGAARENDVVVDDAAVSRAHLEIRLVPAGVSVRDLGSRNGTFYLGQRLGEMVLSLGCRLMIGATELRFDADVADFEGTEASHLREYGQLRGESPSMRRLFGLMKRLEGSLVNVLIEGESGTGKELIARALHQNSSLRDKPFVIVNCGALDRSLVRSELFGHKKGAFTGAHGESDGAVGEADGGTLFLDEIGELPLDVQPMLLRVLESGAYSRVGETRERPVSLRVIAATNRVLSDEVDEGQFRQDLFYRLMVVKLIVEPLRQRSADVVMLARHLATAMGLGELPVKVLDELERRRFPGNVRELKHALLAYGAVGELPAERPTTSEGSLDALLKSSLDVERPYAEQKEELVERMTRIYLELLVVRAQGNRSEAARLAGLQRGYLRRLLEKYGLD